MSRVAARGIVKRYGGVTALGDVDFDAHPGAVNVLIGENGAGKSTLMRIIAGVERPDAGVLTLDGAPVELGSVKDAAAHGIGIVHQELSLCPNLTVAENMFLVDETHKALTLDRASETRRAAEMLARLGATIDPAARAGDLSVGEQQVVEIARVLMRNVSVLILDEPTSALSATEIEKLFSVIGELRAAGVTIIYISHRMQEIERIGDHVTVLRDGRRVACAPRGEFTIAWIVDHMLGTAAKPAPRAPAQAGPPVLRVDALTAQRPNGTVAVDSVTVDVCSGEMTALYGLLGAGRTEFFEALCGARKSRGAIWLGDTELSGAPLHRRLAAGIQLVPEDRKFAGIFDNLAVAQNLSLSVLGKLRRSGILSTRVEHAAVVPMMQRMGVKAPSPSTRIGALSGGNQQKVVIGRSLMPEPRVLLLDEPGRGVDVGARAEIFAAMRELAASGVAILFSTSDLADAMGAADRILVMAHGRITADVRTADTTEEALLRAASAATPHSNAVEAA